MPLSPEASELDALFDAAYDPIERDRPWGRPLLVPGEQLAKAPLVLNPRNRKPRTDGKLPYTRASSLADYISDHSNLDTWRMRSLTKGLSDREDLAALGASLPPIISNTRNRDTLSKEEREQDARTNLVLDQIAEEAIQHANVLYKANWGTAVHSFTDPGPMGPAPARMSADIASWRAETRGWNFHATEMFVANDRYQAAGTFDHLVSIPWLPHLGRMVVDKKTGLLQMDKHRVQLAVYANGEPYDGVTNERPGWPDGVEPNRKWGIVAHIPLGLGRTDLYLLDLEKGDIGAMLAVGVRAYRSDKDGCEPFLPHNDLVLHLSGLISVADSRATLLAIHAEYEDVWDDTFTGLVRQRLAALEVAA